VGAVALLLAAGEGRRLGWAIPKAFVPVGGRPMLEYSLVSIAQCGVIDSVVLVVPRAENRRVAALLSELKDGSLIDTVVSGGDTRQASVRQGLDALPERTEVVICHDAARPFASPALFVRVVEGLSGAEGAVPVIPTHDTVKRVVGGRVVHTLPREEIGLTQTPQAFLVGALKAAHERALGDETDATDDAVLLEGAGFGVAVVEGEPWNFKITFAEDLARANERVAEMATGHPGRDRDA
jgi:2-C-methyl-D-erythritol 4-phosphate cytidylyltransferase